MSAVDPIGLGSVLRLAEENRELASSASNHDLLAADGGVIDQSRLLDVLNGSLASLVVAGEAPRVNLALTSDSEAVIRTGGNRDDIGNI